MTSVKEEASKNIEIPKINTNDLKTENKKELKKESARTNVYVENSNMALLQAKNIKKPMKSSTNELLVDEYDEKCEEHFRIKKLIPLEKTTGKMIIFIILNIVTVGLINLLIMWFPKLNLYIRYSICQLKDAKYIGVYAKDERFYIEDLMKLTLPDISTSLLKKICVYKLNESLNIIYFKFKLFYYIYFETTNSFKCFQFFINNSQKNIIEQFTGGLNQKEIEHQKQLFGICDLIVIIPSIIKLIIIEFSDPFYLFQIFSVILWYCTQYEYYATVIIICTVVSLGSGVYESRINLTSIKSMARYACIVNVFRKNENGEQTQSEIMSTELVPGDLFELPDDGYALPCDCILINGTVIVNESMLTGESTPITKNSMPSVDVNINMESETKYTLFAGTKIVQKRAPGKEKVMAVVYKTGFDTVKGNLIRSILFPKEVSQAFESESLRYILIMATLCVIGFGISIPFLIKRAGMPTKEIIVKFLDLITTTVPPSLPACLGVGVSYALSRLKEGKIICINRERVNTVGKINLISFDKTGTLTEDHLDIYGYRPVIMKENKFIFDSFQENADNYSKDSHKHYKNKVNGSKNMNNDLKKYFVECLACCHGNTIVKGKMIGDPIDVKMFKSCGWELYENIDNQKEENKHILSFVRPKGETDINSEKGVSLSYEELKKHYELSIERRFDFSSKLQRMTVLAKDKNQSYYKAFCKGSPEKIKELCSSSSIPDNFDEILSSYTSKGLRVLAAAVKFINMNVSQCHEISQSFVERDMIFLGLIIVQNKLKSATKSSIEILDKAHLKMVMATGDNILTAIAVSRECNLLTGTIPVFSCELNKNDDNSFKLVWNKINITDNDNDNNIKKEENEEQLDINNNNNINDNNFIDKYPPCEYQKLENVDENDNEKEKIKEEKKQNDINNIDIILENEGLPFKNDDEFAIAISGKTFEMLNSKKKKYLEKNDINYKKYYEVFRIILRHGIVFARMAPEHKTLLVENYREEHFNVMMCGDGANDCGALRAADVGVSLSPEEASIAAHFTSKIPDISCLIVLLREGKASLVTSIQTFKYMMMYSFIQFFAVTLLLIYDSYLSDTQYLVSDVFIILPLAFFIAQTESYPYLTYDIPESSLLSFPILTSIVTHAILTFLFQFIPEVIMRKQSWYVGTCETTELYVYPCSDLNVIYYIICRLYFLFQICNIYGLL